MEIGDIFLLVPSFVHFRDLGIRLAQPLRIIHIVQQIIRMMPVDQGVVKTHAEPFPPEGVQDLADGIPSESGVGDLEISIMGIIETEAFVMFGGQHEILHPGFGRRFGPAFRIEKIGIEIVVIFHVIGIGDPFQIFDPFVAAGNGIKPPVDKHAEAVVSEPFPVSFHELDLFTFEICASVQRNLLQPVCVFSSERLRPQPPT